MTYYTWPTLEAFNTWHDAVIEALNLPRIGVNQASGQPQPDKQATTAYTAVTEVSNVDWRAPVGDDIATTYAAGLGQPSTPPPTPPEP